MLFLDSSSGSLSCGTHLTDGVWVVEEQAERGTFEGVAVVDAVYYGRELMVGFLNKVLLRFLRKDYLVVEVFLFLRDVVDVATVCIVAVDKDVFIVLMPFFQEG